MLATNQVLNKGRYRIINSFSQDETGGFYEAYDTVSNTNVVLKENVGRLGKVATSNQLEAMNAAFLGGAKALTEIKHESLVSVQDYFSEIDRQYLVLESVAGFDLTKFLQADERKPALSDILSWADQLLNALNYLHTLPSAVYHRDIRPENVKLTSSFKVKLLTAGIATNMDPEVITPVPNQTSENTSLHYRPIEQLWGGLDPVSQKVILNSYDDKSERMLMQPLDARSDLYSIGATLYHVLTSTMPADALERSIAILEGKPDPLQKPADLDDSIPPEISDVFMKAMAIRREDRFDSAMILRQVLRTAVVRVKERKAEEAEAAKMNRTASTEVPQELKSHSPADSAEVKKKTPSQQPVVSPPPAAVENKVPEPQIETDSIEAQLEREQRMAEERQRELEAEQARLEEDRKRLEQRRFELEAEKERQRAERERLELEAEQARQKAEQERIAFEAEQERKRLEKERLEREAEKERERAAKKLAELDAAQAHQRAEEERLAHEAEEERSRAEQRLQELQAEQESKRQEKERLQHEAEQERQRAAQKLAELEAEQERQRSEQERLELEAEEERKRAEQRLQELKAEQEHYRSEQKRIEAEAEEERKRAEQRLLELSSVDLDSDSQSTELMPDVEEHIDDSKESDDGLLLELEPNDPTEEASSENFELLENDLFEEESAETPVPETPVGIFAAVEDTSPSVRAYESIYDSSSHDYAESSSFNWRLPAIAGGVVLSLIVLVGAWKFMSADSTEPSPSASTDRTTVLPDAETQAPASDSQSILSSEQPLESNPSAASTDQTVNEPSRINDRARQLQLNAAQEKLKKQAAATAKTPPPKKAVTVDDLINDN